jgi:anti-sigma B factor antagonist
MMCANLFLRAREMLRTMPQFEAKTSVESDGVVVAVTGECDLSVRDEFTSVLLAAVRDAPVVVVDLREVTFLDSSGLHALVTAYHAAGERGSHFYLTNPTGVVADVLEVTGVGELMSLPGDDQPTTSDAGGRS